MYNYIRVCMNKIIDIPTRFLSWNTTEIDHIHNIHIILIDAFTSSYKYYSFAVNKFGFSDIPTSLRHPIIFDDT